jgi:hypothetical protein
MGLDEQAVAAAADAGASLLRRRAAVRDALERVTLRSLVGPEGAEPGITQLARPRAS